MVTPEGLKPVLETRIYGRIGSMSLFRPTVRPLPRAPPRSAFLTLALPS